MSVDDGVKRTPAGKATGLDVDTILQTKGLTKRFGGFTAIDDVDFSLDAGELRCLIGPNGAGKSTLLKLITGRHVATDGRIYFKGRDITGIDPHERVDHGIGMKFQVPSIFEELTAVENMRLPLQRVTDGALSGVVRDEPVAGLSTEERADIADLVDELNDDGIAFVVIEHDIDFVDRIADEVTVLHRGTVFHEGSIEEIRADDDVRRIYLGGE
jgi:branched-chain amino acid transport system ATP-binding protein